jgi:hypothetical protein
MEENDMAYTVWLDGEKIGETALELRHGRDRHGGVFHPTEVGLSVLPGITAMGPALLDAGRMCRESGIDVDALDLDVEGATQRVFETPEGHRILEAAKLIARLELHDASGELVRWESLLISDVNELAALQMTVLPRAESTPIDRSGRDPMRYFISATFDTGRGAGSRRRGARPVS